MTEQPVPGFGGVLRRLRTEAKLTQEELAEAAGLSPRTVSDLERGVKRTAHKDTAELLAEALKLAEPARGVFVAAARGRVPAAEVLAVRAEALEAFVGNLPIQPSSFVGRADELTELAAAVQRSSLVTVTGVGGVGKTRRRGARSTPATSSWRNGGPRTPWENRHPAIRTASGSREACSPGPTR